VDRVGRKLHMLGSVTACCAFLIVETAMIASFASPIGPVPNEASYMCCCSVSRCLADILHIASETRSDW